MDYLNRIFRVALFLPPQSSSVAPHIDALHYVVIGVSLLGALSIFVVAGVCVVRYRQPALRQHGQARTLAPTPSLGAELAIIFGLFALFVGFWGVGFWQYVGVASPPADAYDIYASAKQWMWKFAYPDGSHTIGTMYVPAGKPVRVILTSRDVIHSFYVPDFRVKHDAVPGRYTTAWFTAPEPGSHRIFCSEYCGTWHSRMLGQVVALDGADFDRWLAQGERERDQPLDPDLPEVSADQSSLVSRGERLAARQGCLRCHSVDGSPHIGPTWAGLYRASVPLQGGQTVVADVPYLTESMMDPQAKLHAGYEAVMPSYIGALDPGETAALVAYIQSLQHVALGAPEHPIDPLPRQPTWPAGQARPAEPAGSEQAERPDANAATLSPAPGDAPQETQP